MLNSQNDAGLLISVAEIAELFQAGARYHDDRTLGELVKPILVPILETLILKLAELRNREMRIISEIPRRFVRENANEEEEAA